ncbi:MAG: hypothetical protein ACRC8K_14675, partial [Waterburya sp.]
VTVTNNSNITSKGITLNQTFTELTTFRSSSIDPVEHHDNTITFDLGNLEAGESKKIDITVTADQNEIDYVEQNLSNFVMENNGNAAFHVFEL